ncbi:FkbM family methyltransferase [Lichenicola cladoniae]|uniref:FkbM family methyltransferase n=1 Tax=Lichenicola cladoniae TaxID=1484109 RepID=A0A6M8HUR1_9PROT|nr:FkbM family methyltransferase [Lichenicola cladoniae]NPD66248.1 FkbM family methyltransferase [Acetobacteraceae bacterium]QKE92102.1 FkbM family methyltransferase [Lichenicola cladoniae]
MTFISYAQNCEDVLLWRALGHVAGGFYIDVGAQHPDTDSVTRAFYDRGWSGVNIEPVVEQASRLQAARPRDITLQIALGAQAGEAPFHVVDGTGLSTLDGAVAATYAGTAHKVRETTIPVLTLAEICRLYAPPDIHFLKVDVEGAERAVLEGADLVSFRPWIILAEATAPLSTRETHAVWEPLLTAVDYVFVWFDGLNRYYVARERLDALGPCFRTPPNVFDDFLRANDSSLIGRLGTAEAEREALQVRLQAADAALHEQALLTQRLVARTGHEIAQLRQAVADRDAEVLTAKADADRIITDMGHTLHASRHELQQTHLRLQKALLQREQAQLQLQQTHMRLQQAHLQIQAVELDAATLRDTLHALRHSTSWRLTEPLRRLVSITRRTGDPDPQVPVVAPALLEPYPVQDVPEQPPADRPPPVAAPEEVQAETPDPLPEPELDDPASQPPAQPALPILPPPGSTRLEPGQAMSGGLLAVHQFHSGSAVGDAITNAMLLTRSLLRSMGYRSEIYTEHPPKALAHELRPFEELPRHDGYVLIVRHSMGYDRFAQVLDLPAPKILFYHNITPPELLVRHPHLAHYARLGRSQLGAFKNQVSVSLADSDFNAIELHRLDIAPVRVCTLLFDVDALRARAAAAVPAALVLRDAGSGHGAWFTILFVGRINDAKGQLALVEAFAVFRTRYQAPARLVLVGRDGGVDDLYARLLRERIATLGLESSVLLTGGVTDDELDAWYGAADLYVSLSRHEGFGVPLVEAMAHGVPVLAWPGGAVPYTLAGAGRLLDDTAPETVATAMLDLASDESERMSQRARQAARLDGLGLDRQCVVLQQALLRAGAALPLNRTTASMLGANLRFSVTGHVNGSYSLAAINRDLALDLEAARPGRVRLLPVEGTTTLDLSGVPSEQADAIAALVHRQPHATGPELVISQHYPVHVPPRPGDVSVATLFWEESLLPARTIDLLAANFRAVVAPTGFVRDALIESGLGIPVRVIPPAVALGQFAALREIRAVEPVGATHRFLHVSSCFPRKGVDVLLRAWARAFRAGDPVRLLIKGFPNPHNEVAAMLAALRHADPELAPIELVDRDLEPAELVGLYRDADTMVLPTRGEGFNLPAAEALSAGLHLIVTGRGGHTQFCADGDAPHPGVRLLRCRSEPSQTHLATPHSLWLEPDEDDLVVALHEALSPRSVEVQPPVLPDAEALAGAYAALAIDLLLAPPRMPVRVSWVSSWSQRCGVAEYSRQLLAGLAGAPGEGSFRVRVLCDTRTPSVPAEADRFWPCWQMGDPRSLHPLAAAIAADDADAVMLQHQPGLLSFMTLAELIAHPALAGRVLLATLHNTRLLDELVPAELAHVLAALARLDRVLVHTVADLRRLQGLGILSNLTLLPHGAAVSLPPAPVHRFEHAVEQWQYEITRRPPLIGCYGFFLPGKGIDTLIQAMAELRQRWPGARLLLVNAEYDADISREEIARCLDLASSLGLDEVVTFRTGFMPNDMSLELLAMCDVLALPYLPSKEASSAALRTAMTAGVPVAVTPIELFAEAGDAVFRFAGIDASSVATGLDRLISDADLREQLQASAQTWIADRQWGDIAHLLQGMMTGLVRTGALNR